MKTPAKRMRRYADGGIVNVAAPPIGMTDVSGGVAQQQAIPQYTGFQQQPGTETVGTGITQPQGPMIAKNRATGALGVAPETQTFAKGGLVKKPAKGKVAKMAKGGMMCSPRKRMAMGMKKGGK